MKKSQILIFVAWLLTAVPSLVGQVTVSGATILSGGGVGNYLPLAGGNLFGALYGPNINGVIYPAQCGGSSPASWCAGTTPDAWIRAACTQLPNGGFMSFYGMTGNIVAPATCSTPTKQVIFIEDPTSPLIITEADGGIPFPIDSASMFLGPGKGQCQNAGGIHLAATANVTAIVGPAHTDGTQENWTAEGLCLYGASGATVGQSLLYTKNTFANTTFEGNNLFVCNTACIKTVNGATQILNNWANVSDGVTGITGVPLIIFAGGNGNGCGGGAQVTGGQYEHALGGGPEISVTGNSAGAQICSASIRDVAIERTSTGTGSTIGIKIQDCMDCLVENVTSTGSSSGAQDLINVSQSASGLTQNVTLNDISNVFQIYPNTINDTTAGGLVLTALAAPHVTSYLAAAGYVTPPVLPGTTLLSLGSDAMAGAGSFATGSGTLPTGFGMTGCLSGQGLTCTYTRTNSTAPAGYTYSQEVQITGNTGGGSGFNGIQYSTGVSFTAGNQYAITFWGKGDGTFAGLPTFLLWNSSTSVTACQTSALSPFSTTWTLYSLSCTPTTTGTLNLAFTALTPIGATGTFYIAGPIFSPVQPLTAGTLLAAVGPYGVGAATLTTTGTSGPATISGGVLNIPQYSGGGGSGVSSINSTTGAFTFSFSGGAGSCSGTTCTFTGSGSGGGSVTNFIAGTWPSWLTPSVATSTITPTLTVTASAIPNSILANSAVTIGSTSVSLGATAATIAGLTLTSPTLTTPALGTPTALTLTNATGLPWTGLTGSPSTSQVPFQSLTTTGTSGPATLSAGVLNVPQYGSGSISGSLTSGYLPVATGVNTLGNSHIDDGVTTTAVITSAEPITVKATVPGSISIVAGTGSIPTLPTGSAGLAAPASGGTPYLIKPPATASSGFIFGAAPATGDGVNEWAWTPQSVESIITVVAEQYGSYAANSWLVGTKPGHAGHFTNVQVANTSPSTCTTSPSFTVVDRTASTTGANATVAVTGSAAGVIQDTAQTLTYAAGDDIGLIVSVQGTGCGSNFFAISATLSTP